MRERDRAAVDGQRQWPSLLSAIVGVRAVRTALSMRTNAKRSDGQVSGLAGEFFVAAELLKRGLQTSVTFGNAKAIDLFAFNGETGRTFTVQVKALRKKNFFLISHAGVNPQHVYVFVLLNEPGQAVEYFVVPGRVLKAEPQRFSKWFLVPKMPGIHPDIFRQQGFQDAWQVFHE
jgi:hypothetical protein